MPYTKYVDENDEKTAPENTIITSDADVTSTVNSEMTATVANIEAAYRSFTDATQSSKETHIVCIGPDVEKSLVEAGQYLPLVNKLTKYIIPDLSLYDVVMLSLNVASLTTQGAKDYSNTEVTGAQVLVYFILKCIDYSLNSNSQPFLLNASDFQKSYKHKKNIH